ncbi:hypothetical protein LOD99_6261 [Oopsacas minuta]|uniref:Uncharacterized protein n=1 Tax=Oopsacas minuta TaxID=111878 RepID=A0AAV7JMP3_9METZ|nr:hypothetical protein LOD99_6261 [Oopsacas minuta]
MIPSMNFFSNALLLRTNPIPDPQTPTPTSSLVTLLGVKPLDPIQIITPSISSNEKNLSISELSSYNTFLTGTTINSFCTLLKKNFPHFRDFRVLFSPEHIEYLQHCSRISFSIFTLPVLFGKMNVCDHGVELRSKAIGKLEGDITQKEVAKLLDVGIRSVRRWWSQHKCGETMETKPRSGRPQILKRVS